jgi:hypothetical protein
MKRIGYAVLLAFVAGCSQSAGPGMNAATPPPANRPVGSESPKATGALTQPFGESQGVGIAPDQ